MDSSTGRIGNPRRLNDSRRPSWQSLLLAPLLLGIIAGVSIADVLELRSERDNTIFADGDLSNGAGPSIFSGNTGNGSTRRALIYFEVVGRLPVGAHIDSVLLTLQVTNTPNDVPRRFALYRMRRDWGEAASIATGGGGASADIGDATWQD